MVTTCHLPSIHGPAIHAMRPSGVEDLHSSLLPCQLVCSPCFGADRFVVGPCIFLPFFPWFFKWNEPINRLHLWKVAVRQDFTCLSRSFPRVLISNPCWNSKWWWNLQNQVTIAIWIIWRFPKMGYPQLIHVIFGFSILTHPIHFGDRDPPLKGIQKPPENQHGRQASS